MLQYLRLIACLDDCRSEYQPYGVHESRVHFRPSKVPVRFDAATPSHDLWLLSKGSESFLLVFENLDIRRFFNCRRTGPRIDALILLGIQNNLSAVREGWLGRYRARDWATGYDNNALPGPKKILGGESECVVAESEWLGDSRIVSECGRS